MPTAILVDGGYFLHRYRLLPGRRDGVSAEQVSRELFTWALAHLDDRDAGRRQLYRIFFYDCPPLQKKAHHPITGRSIDFSRTPEARFRRELHLELVKKRKVALRLGRLADHAWWTVKPDKLKEVLARKLTVDQLTESDVYYEYHQKGVDMRIGLDIAALAFKKQVDQIILVAGDADFVPAAKLARREGIDFVLDPMWGPLPDDLHEHVDGIKSTCPKPGITS